MERKTIVDAIEHWPVNQFDAELAKRLCEEWNTSPPKHQNWRLFLREHVPVEKEVCCKLSSGAIAPNATTYFGPWIGRVIRKAELFR